MEGRNGQRADAFMHLYRQMEGVLEKRLSGREAGGSVVSAYLSDPDSEPMRSEIELCRRIRNILAHNAEDTGEPVVEPSEGMLRRMAAVLDHVKKPVMAINYGTPAEKIVLAHPNDLAVNVMRHMVNRGYSHVPVAVQERVVGVFSSDSLMQHAAKHGLSQLRDELRIGDMKDLIGFGDKRNERFLFLPVDATLPLVRSAFEKRQARDHRLAVVFLTEDGTQSSPLRALLTSWDVLREDGRK